MKRRYEKGREAADIIFPCEVLMNSVKDAVSDLLNYAGKFSDKAWTGASSRGVSSGYLCMSPGHMSGGYPGFPIIIIPRSPVW